MVNRKKRGIINKQQVLDKLRMGREGALQVRGEGKIYSDEFVLAGEVNQAIDRLAENLTGDKTYFHLKPHR